MILLPVPAPRLSLLSLPHALAAAAAFAASRLHFTFFGTIFTLPPAASIFAIAVSENAVAATVTPPDDISPSPSTLSGKFL